MLCMSQMVRGYLWVSIQTNTMNDAGYISEDFNEAVESMECALQENNFIVTGFGCNMRNAKNICAAAKNISIDSGARKVNNKIEDLTAETNTNSAIPMAITMNQKDKQEHFGQILRRAISLSDSSSPCIIIMYDSGEFNSTDIKKAVMEECVDVEQEPITMYPEDMPEKATIEDFMHTYLLCPNKYLIVEDLYFTGMEAQSVIYCKDVSNEFTTSNRCHILRATSSFVMVQLLDDAQDRKQFYPGMQMDS